MRKEATSQAESRGDRCLAGSLLNRALVAGLFLAAGMAPFAARAQTNAAKAPLSANRWLLIVDTSRAMHRRSDAVLKEIEGLLMSGLNGQLRRGDTLGLWTFNRDLYTGHFPLQTWSPGAKKEVTSRVLAFLEAQKYGSRVNFEKVRPSLAAVVRDSDVITIILISSGEEDVHGTPFDARINGFYQQWRDQQRKARMPFITILRAKGGKLTDCTVSTPPWPVQMPALPQERRPTQTVRNKVQKAAHKNPPPTAAPLIFSGSNPEPVTKVTPKPAPAVAQAETASSAPVPANASKAPSAQLPQPSAPPAGGAVAQPPSKAPEASPTQAPLIPAAAPVAVVEPKVEVPRTSEPVPAQAAPSKPEAAPVLPAPAATPKPAAVAPPKPAPAPETTPAPASMVAAAQEAPAAAPIETGPAGPRPSPRHASSTESATAVPSESLMSRWSLWIAGLVLGLAAIGFFILLRRRSRPAPPGSLITRSFERDKKP